jgi:succinate dehydrogenase / fumarate reductase, cytochrome b subunit
MSAALTLYRSSIGKKAVMAITGLILVGFVVVHMLGNLKIFQGREHFNEYAEFLRIVGAPALPEGTLLWIARLVLLGAVGLHILAAVQLTRMDLAGRPQRYATHKKVRGSYASLTMRYGGVIIALFVVYHLLHFTTGTLHGNFIHGDVYHNVIVGFQNWFVSGIYIIAQVALGLHLYHGVWSMFQTLGTNNHRTTGWLRGLAIVVALLVFVGNITIPLAVLTGLVRL